MPLVYLSVYFLYRPIPKCIGLPHIPQCFSIYMYLLSGLFVGLWNCGGIDKYKGGVNMRKSQIYIEKYFKTLKHRKK